MASNLYAVDGLCHNAEPGTFNHECGKPATWLGTTAGGFTMGFCDACKREGWEASSCVSWARAPDAPAARTELTAVGEQHVLPGCERVVRQSGKQLGLWD